MIIVVRDIDDFQKIIIRKGHTKKSFSAEVGIGQVTGLQICNGNRNPSPRTAKKICDALEVQFDQIFEIVRPESKRGLDEGR